MRLQKYIANSGYTSRRKAEILIEEGRVRLNGKVAKERGLQVQDGDIVEIDGIRLSNNIKYIYILLNKPKGVITTVSDEQERKTVIDCIKCVKERIYPVGRLDKDTEGLLILTNDGDLTQVLTHPSYEVEKTYYVVTDTDLNEKEMNGIRKGVPIDGRNTYPAKLKKIQPRHFQITIHEGRNRIVRKLFDYFGHTVIELIRTGYAFLRLSNLKPGEWRYLNYNEIKRLKKLQGG